MLYYLYEKENIMIQVISSFMATVLSLIIFGVIAYLWKEAFVMFDTAPALSVFTSIVLDIFGMVFLVYFIRFANIFYTTLKGLL